jgi:hypothetical protein
MLRLLLILALLTMGLASEEEESDSLLERYFPTGTRWWGTAMLSYKAQKSGEHGFFETPNNAFSATIVLGSEQWLMEGVGIGWELAGWSDLGLGIAEAPRVSESITSSYLAGLRSLSGAELSQSYLAWTWGQSLWKAGRMALPKRLSPWLWSDRSAGVLDLTYEGLTVSYWTPGGMLWYGGWIDRAVNGGDVTFLGARQNGVSLLKSGVVFVTGLQSEEGSEWSLSAYYLGNSFHRLPTGEEKGHGFQEWSLWGIWTGTKLAALRGVQLIYVDGKAPGYRSTFGGALRFEREWEAHRLRLTLAAHNGGDYSLKSAGMGVGSGAFWGSSISGEFGSDSVGARMWLGRLDYFYDLEQGGRWYAGVAAADFDGEGRYRYRQALGARIGRRFELGPFFGKLEYRLRNMEYQGGRTELRQRLRGDLGYRF